MRDDELSAIVGTQISNALGSRIGTGAGSELSEQRETALKYYLGEPFGNEVDGRSQVVLTEVADTIEWLLPGLIEVFMAGDEVVRFEPQYQEDEAAAKQATEYVNYIFNQDNPGFTILYDVFKDALLQKTGTAKVFWEDTEETKRETFTGLTPDEVALIMQPENGDAPEVIAYTMDPVTGLADLKVQREFADGRVRVESVPPEEFLISQRGTTTENAPFVAHRVTKTVTELLDMGFDEATVRDLPDYSAADHDIETIARGAFDGTNNIDDKAVDDSMRTILVHECYLKMDYDGDGKAELRCITVAGPEHVVLENEEVDEVPFISVCPVPMPHKYHGLSIADLTMDLQFIKSTVLRQILDNTYNINNARTFANDRVNLDDLLNNTIGGVVRVDGEGPIGDSASPVVTAPIGQQLFPMLEYLDQVRESRTGVSRYNQGLDPDALNDTAAGIGMLQSASLKRQALIARIFAETGVKNLFLKILRLVIANQDRPRMIRLRNEWIPMDPRDWNAKMDVTISVGLGNGNKDQQGLLLNHVLQVQQAIVGFQGGIDGPLVKLENIYNTLDKMVQAGGFKSADPFFTDPQNAQQQPPKPPPPDPRMMEMQAKMQLEQQKMQHQMQMDQAKASSQAQIDQAKAQTDAQRQQIEAQIKREVAVESARLEREKATTQMELELMKIQLQNALEREKAGLEVEMSAERIMAEMELKAREMSERNSQSEMQAMGIGTLGDLAEKLAAATDQANATLQLGDIAKQLEAATKNAEAAAQAATDSAGSSGAAMASLVEAIQAGQTAQTQAMAQLAAALTAMAGPKKVVRDGSGQVVGVEPATVN
jgi:hypothetical protein